MVLFPESLASNVGCLKVHALVPLLFTIYSTKLFSIIKSHLPSAHSYVDDTQLYLSFRPLESPCEAEALNAMEKCTAHVRSWMINDELTLNDDKAEFLVIGTSKKLSKVSVSIIRVGDVDVIPVHSVKNLGPWFDSHMDMATHITKTCGSAFFYLYNFRHIQKYLTSECTEKLIHAFITSKLDYCNSLLYGGPDHHMQKLQRDMNASARLIFCPPKHCHITPLLQNFTGCLSAYLLSLKSFWSTLKYSSTQLLNISLI